MESEGIRLYGISDPFHLYHGAFLSQAEQNQDRAPLSKHKAMEPASPCMAHRPHGALGRASLARCVAGDTMEPVGRMAQCCRKDPTWEAKALRSCEPSSSGAGTERAE